jgi:hypothetical protein
VFHPLIRWRSHCAHTEPYHLHKSNICDLAATLTSPDTPAEFYNSRSSLFTITEPTTVIPYKMEALTGTSTGEFSLSPKGNIVSSDRWDAC